MGQVVGGQSLVSPQSAPQAMMMSMMMSSIVLPPFCPSGRVNERAPPHCPGQTAVSSSKGGPVPVPVGWGEGSRGLEPSAHALDYIV